MADFSTTITRATGVYSNTSPITFTITFGTAIDADSFVLADVNVTGGSKIQLTGSGTTWSLIVSPNTQGSLVSVQMPANKVVDDATGTDDNLVSNIFSVTYNSIRPRAIISFNDKVITNSRKFQFTVTFDKDVTGFTAGDITVENAVIKSISGTGSTYIVNAEALSSSAYKELSFSVNDGAAVDIFGNTTRVSNTLVIEYDPEDIDDKSDECEDSIDAEEVLVAFRLNELKQVAGIQMLADCSKDIPQRLLDMAMGKAFDMVMSNPTAQKLANSVQLIQSKLDTVMQLVEQVQEVAENPTTLLEELLAAGTLTGDAYFKALQDIANKFDAVSGLDSIIASVLATGVCGQPNYYTNGSMTPRQTITPTAQTPPFVPGVQSAVTSTYDSGPKDRYDEFTFQLKEFLETQSVEPQLPDRARMLSVLTTLAMGYHDNIVNANDASKDYEFLTKYLDNVEHEKTSNSADWDQTTKDQFASRAASIGNLIKTNAGVIRAFLNMNKPLTGNAVSTGITVYSGPDADFTTFLDIKPAERPANLAAYWTSKGYNIPAQEAKLNGRGIKTGTLPYSDAFNGAYGPLKSDFTCASTRFPGGSVIALRNPDGTPYNPSGKNPTGQFTVTDTGNQALTYAKPDIYTATPAQYKGMESVQVFLVAEGTKKGPKYVESHA